MANTALTEWVLENGGPAIRYRVATELLDDVRGVDVEGLARELLESSLVMRWLQRLGTDTRFSHIHSSQFTAYENAMGKLVQLGCKNGMEPFDARTQPFRTWLAKEVPEPQGDWSPFLRMVVGTFLALAGYLQDGALRDYLDHRLHLLNEFARRRDYDLYLRRGAYHDIPRGLRDRPLVKPELFESGEQRFPSIYDIQALAHYPGDLMDGAAQRRIDTVIDYVLHPDYQALPHGYGIMRAGRGRYPAIGWSVHLYGYDGFDVVGPRAGEFVQRLALMAHFPTARKHRWFRQGLAHLEGYRTQRGTYLFPRPYLQEHRRGYWVTGAYMGLEQSRRARLSLELESTFWMLKMKKLATPQEAPLE
jgi:hypothetical protein